MNLSCATSTILTLYQELGSDSEVQQNIVSVERILHQIQVEHEAPKFWIRDPMACGHHKVQLSFGKILLLISTASHGFHREYSTTTFFWVQWFSSHLSLCFVLSSLCTTRSTWLCWYNDNWPAWLCVNYFSAVTVIWYDCFRAFCHTQLECSSIIGLVWRNP